MYQNAIRTFSQQHNQNAKNGKLTQEIQGLRTADYEEGVERKGGRCHSHAHLGKIHHLQGSYIGVNGTAQLFGRKERCNNQLYYKDNLQQ